MIESRLKLIKEAHEGWRAFFEKCGEQPFKLAYEDFVENYEGTVLTILDYLKVAVPANFTFREPRMRKQADDLNDEWVREYLLVQQERGESLT